MNILATAKANNVKVATFVNGVTIALSQGESLIASTPSRTWWHCDATGRKTLIDRKTAENALDNSLFTPGAEPYVHVDSNGTKEVTARNFRISVTQGMSGYFAILVADYKDMDWNTDIVSTGIGRFATYAGAAAEGREWARCEGIQFEELPTTTPASLPS
jgi:hypothetical protein